MSFGPLASSVWIQIALYGATSCIMQFFVCGGVCGGVCVECFNFWGCVLCISFMCTK